MEPCEQADDNKYTVGIAASLCLLSLPVIYCATRPVVSMLHRPWTPSFVVALFMFVPLLMAFITLYCHAWHPEWSRPKRVLLSVFLSFVIFGADLVFLCFLTLESILLGNCLNVGG